MAPVENRWTKKRKAEEEAAVIPAANVVVQFHSDAGVQTGNQTQIQLKFVSVCAFADSGHGTACDKELDVLQVPSLASLKMLMSSSSMSY